MIMQNQICLSFQCNLQEFSCHDGTCLNSSVRCNGINECFDGSDEIDCRVLKISQDSYLGANPPVTDDRRTIINVSTEIFYIRSFDPKAMTFVVGFKFEMFWFDSRIKFANLKNGTSGAQMLESEKQLIWIPKIFFSNSLQSID